MHVSPALRRSYRYAPAYVNATYPRAVLNIRMYVYFSRCFTVALIRHVHRFRFQFWKWICCSASKCLQQMLYCYTYTYTAYVPMYVCMELSPSLLLPMLWRGLLFHYPARLLLPLDSKCEVKTLTFSLSVSKFQISLSA